MVMVGALTLPVAVVFLIEIPAPELVVAVEV